MKPEGPTSAADLDDILLHSLLPAKCPWTRSCTYLLVYASLICWLFAPQSNHSLDGVLGSIGTCMTSAAGQVTRLFAMQGLRIDESTAMYYLKESGGDLKKAVKLFGVLLSSLLSPHRFPFACLQMLKSAGCSRPA